MIKRINEFWGTVVVVLVVVLLASWIIYNSNENQKEIIRTVREAQQAKERQNSETLEEIRKRMGDEEAWQKASESINDSLRK